MARLQTRVPRAFQTARQITNGSGMRSTFSAHAERRNHIQYGGNVFGRVSGGVSQPSASDSFSSAMSSTSKASHFGKPGVEKSGFPWGKASKGAGGVALAGAGIAALSVAAISEGSSGGGVPGEDPHSSYGIQPVGGEGTSGGTPDPHGVAPSGALNLETIQETPPTDINQYTTDFIEVPQSTGGLALETPIEANYDVESIKSWFGRAFPIAGVSLASSTSVIIDPAMIEQVAARHLDYFQYFRGDMVFTFRWNVPKTSFGAFVALYNPGDVIAVNDRDSDHAICKTFVDLQGSEATLTVPWFFQTAFYDRSWDTTASPYRFGVLKIEVLSPLSTVTDLLASSNLRVYLSFTNVSIMTPIPKPVPQGAALSILGSLGAGIGAGIATNEIANKMHPQQQYMAMGEHTMRIFNEGLNLLRVEGADPAVPVARNYGNVAPVGDDFAISDYNQLGLIPSYALVPLPSGQTASFLSPSAHAWLRHIRDVHHFVRADFGIRLHFVGTPFHSGRLRIIYVPDIVAAASAYSAMSQFDAAMGSSIVWDLQTDQMIDLVVPYGHPLEYNVYPGLVIYNERDIQSPFDSVVLPAVWAEIVCTNISVMGYNGYTRMQTIINGSYNPPPYRSQATSLLEPQGIVTTGWYNDVHCSEDETDVSLATTARRPGPLVDSTTGGLKVFALTSAFQTIPICKWLNGLGPADNISLASPIAPFLARCCGWRGSVKVSIVCNDASVSLRVMPVFGTTNDIGLGYCVNGAGFAELVMPYYTPYLFYGNRVDLFSLRVQASANTDAWIYLSFLEDFEILWPTGIRTAASTVINLPLQDEDETQPATLSGDSIIAE